VQDGSLLGKASGKWMRNSWLAVAMEAGRIREMEPDGVQKRFNQDRILKRLVEPGDGAN
jgi:hypothetical protein